MTPHEQIKSDWGYVKRAPVCGNCDYFEPARIRREGGVTVDLQDVSTCAKGQFPVSAKAVCNKHTPKTGGWN